jgi:hypothetical protein
VTVVDTPPRPQPSQDELEALIEEARRRTRRRRLAYAATAVAVVLAAGTVLLILALMRGGGSRTGVPKGFVLVHARGPVQHALLEQLAPLDRTSITLSSGKTRPTRITSEIWWDARDGLFRTVYREDGHVVSDFVQNGCQGVAPRRFCLPPSPFDLGVKGLGWPPRAGVTRRDGTFRGRPVVWIADEGGDEVAFDTLTHRPVSRRVIFRSGPARFRGRVFDAEAITALPDLPAKKVSFAVPHGGAPRNASLKEIDFEKASFARARAALGRAPLWLGDSYQRHRLRFVQTARNGAQGVNDTAVGLVPFVRLDYGAFRIDEFGDRRPIWFEEGPPPGVVVAEPRFTFAFERYGVLVMVFGPGAAKVDRAAVMALAQALRPVG